MDRILWSLIQMGALQINASCSTHFLRPERRNRSAVSSRGRQMISLWLNYVETFQTMFDGGATLVAIFPNLMP